MDFLFPLRKLVEAHKKWLSLQEGYETAKGYEPQPFEQLARVLRNDGKYEVANEIALKKLSFERKFKYPWWAKRLFPAMWIMEHGFSYGLFAGRGVCIFGVLLILGTYGVDYINYGCLRLSPIVSLRDCTSYFGNKHAGWSTP